MFGESGPDLSVRGTWGMGKAPAHKLLLAGVAAYCPKFHGKVPKVPPSSGS
ncbi:hypothetical protein Srufu_013560 [Streptomyces libani subsp. rufus]|nr:hypothetical protein Srufu_013560 [Streptomyces libani subsp. rufus]